MVFACLLVLGGCANVSPEERAALIEKSTTPGTDARCGNFGITGIVTLGVHACYERERKEE